MPRRMDRGPDRTPIAWACCEPVTSGKDAGCELPRKIGRNRVEFECSDTETGDVIGLGW